MGQDLIVIGRGPVAEAACREAALLGHRVLLAKPALPGAGMPPWTELPRLRRAIASRMLSRSGAVRHRATPAASSDVRRIEQELRAHLGALRASDAPRLQIAKGAVRIEDAHSVRVAGVRYQADALVLVAATRPRRPERFPFDDRVVYDADSVLWPERRLRSLAVVGASEEGCEVASLFAALGVSVMLIDRRARLLRSIDRDVLRAFHGALQRQGVEIVLEDEVATLEIRSEAKEPCAVAILGSGRSETFDAVAICAGRVPSQAGVEFDLGLDRDERGFIMIDEWARSSEPGVFAVGEAAGAPTEVGAQLQRARVAVRRAVGIEATDPEWPPTTIHAVPQLAFAGFSEEACERLGTPCVVGRTSQAELRIGLGGGEAGLLKLIVDASNRCVVGMHAIGAEASSTVHIGAALLQAKPTVDHLADALFPSASPAEALRLAGCDAIARLAERADAPRRPLKLRLAPRPKPASNA